MSNSMEISHSMKLMWFKNDIPQFSVPTETLQNMPHSHSPPPSPCSWGGKLEVKGKNHGQEQFTGNSNEIRKEQ